MNKKRLTPFWVKLLFAGVFLLALFFRSYGINWDSGFHLHPDERAIIMTSLQLHMPANLSDFLSIQSPLNPHFFAYGNFPMYLLAFASWLLGFISPQLTGYDGMLLVGRTLSIGFDMGTLCLVYFLGKKLRNQHAGLIGAFFYSVSILPIQLSHFYAVDTLLTFFTTLCLYTAILFYERSSLKKVIFVGITFGLSLATKISAAVLAISLGAALVTDDVFLGIKHIRTRSHALIHLRRFLPSFLLFLIIIAVSSLATVLLTQPYVLIDKTEFLSQTQAQSVMTKNAFVFPYTLQYVGIVHYVYELRNLILFGQGTLLSLLSFLGLIYSVFVIFGKDKTQKWAQETILLVFVLVYFAIVGNFAVGFMRYLLPLYPLLCLFAALFCEHLLVLLRAYKTSLFAFVCIIFAASLLLFPLTFLHIYTLPNTRVQATNWITTHIPKGKTLAVEHWDDALPLVDQSNYQMVTLPLYDPDTASKWQVINQSLKCTDYIIIASRRLLGPLTRLTNCRLLPQNYCYPLTASYYKKLLSGKLGFSKVADFSVTPVVPLIHVAIPDDSADESFTVYDHPHVMIFEKVAEIR